MALANNITKDLIEQITPDPVMLILSYSACVADVHEKLTCNPLCTSIPGMGSRQFCQGRKVEAEARQGSNVVNQGDAIKAEAERSRPRRGRLYSRQGRGEATPWKKPSFP